MTARPMTEKLEPCPFCGGEATLNRIWTSGVRVECTPCRIYTPEFFPGNKADAVAAWNRRSTSAAVRGMREALERYRYAARWNGADSWDGCPECVDRLRWASEKDIRDMTTDGLAAIGREYFADRSPALSGIEPGEDEQARPSGSAPISTDTKGTTK